MWWQSIPGLVILIGLAWAFSENRPQINWRLVISAIVLQFLLAILLLKIRLFQWLFAQMNGLLLSLSNATLEGTKLVFGYIGGGPAPFAPGGDKSATTFILAFQAFPLILVMSALSAVLFYWRVLPMVIGWLGKGLQKTLGISGALAFASAANIFVGMIEAPVLIRLYLQHMSRAEMFALMTCGMATIAGTVMVLYANFISASVPGALGHILTASLISAPAALMFAALLVPCGRQPDHDAAAAAPHMDYLSTMDAITKGTMQGVKLVLNIIAMLIVFVALIYLVNVLLSLIPPINGQPVTLQLILGYLMAPMVWLIGIPWDEAVTAGYLMGIKTVFNELFAYLELAKASPESLSPRSKLIMTYALCGFANFGSLGIMLGGLTTMVPEQRTMVVELGLKSILAGTLSTLMTGAVVSLLL